MQSLQYRDDVVHVAFDAPDESPDGRLVVEEPLDARRVLPWAKHAGDEDVVGRSATERSCAPATRRVPAATSSTACSPR